MCAIENDNGHSNCAAPASALRAELVDGVTDALVAASGRAGRADVIARLVGEVYASVAWMGADDDGEELLSLRHLVDEATAHSRRSRSLRGGRSRSRQHGSGRASA